MRYARADQAISFARVIEHVQSKLWLFKRKTHII
jgi:hypothetical protein